MADPATIAANMTTVNNTATATTSALTALYTTFAPEVAADLADNGFNVTALEMIPGVNIELIMENTEDLCNRTICSLELANFTYLPTLPGNVIYLALFAALVLPQIALCIRYKAWSYGIPILIGLLGEIVGYVGRVQMHYNPFPKNPFLTYLICLTIAPAFFSAATYLCLGRIVETYSASVSRLKPQYYTYIFVSCDLVSLILQAAGGAVTATADDGDRKMKDMGVDIMIAGLAFQVASLALFIALSSEYAWRLRKNWASRNLHMAHIYEARAWKLFLLGIMVATITIFIRCCFRVAELTEGFSGELFNDELTFMIFEGPMLIAAAACLTFFHPGFALGNLWSYSTLRAAAENPDAQVFKQDQMESPRGSTEEYEEAKNTVHADARRVQSTAP